MAERKIKSVDRKRYLLPEKQDLEILFKIYDLEKKNLKAKDRVMIKFIRSQLEQDWRKHLVRILNSLLKRYG